MDVKDFIPFQFSRKTHRVMPGGAGIHAFLGPSSAMPKSWIPAKAGMTVESVKTVAPELGRQDHRRMGAAFVYIMASGPNGALYVGITSDLLRRVWQHRTGAMSGFTKRYGVKTLVWLEAHVDTSAAITREKEMKH